MTAPSEWDRLEDLYDRRTLAALDTGIEPSGSAARPPEAAVPSGLRPGWRRSVAGGAVLAGLGIGLREVFDPDAAREPVFEVAPDPGLQPVDGIILFFVPGDPKATIALVLRDDARRGGEHGDDGRSRPVDRSLT